MSDGSGSGRGGGRGGRGRKDGPPVAPRLAFDPEPSARFAAEVLQQARIDGAVIGRVALWSWLPDPADHPFTKDLDLAVSREDLIRLRGWLAGQQDLSVRELSIGGVNVGKPAEGISVDFVDRTSPEWGDLGLLFEEAVQWARSSGRKVELAGKRLHVVGPEHLVAMKLGTGERKDDDDARRLLEAAARGELPLAVAELRALAAEHLGPAGRGRLEALLREAGHPAARPRQRYKPTGSGSGG